MSEVNQSSHRPDGPKSLGEVAACQARKASLYDAHMRDLTALVEAIRSETGFGEDVPDFDPADGGAEARCLFLLEAPGRRAVNSGFGSRDNADQTAKNLFELNRLAGIPREYAVIWNIVPWYIGPGTKIRPAGRKDVAAASPYLAGLLAALPRLEIVVLVGKKAYIAKDQVLGLMPPVRIVGMPHPSPLFVNRLPGNRALILNALQEVARLLGLGSIRFT
jgi:uracil-DNA glycosylase